MNSRERVLTALHRSGVPDCPPLQFDLCRSLLEHFGQVYNIPVDYTTSYYEDITYRISANDLRTRMGSDCVVVGASLPAGYTHPVTADGCIINEFGMKMRQGVLYMEVIEEPLAGVTSASQVRSFSFPNPLADGRFTKAERDIARFKKDYFVIGDLELTMFEMAWHMVGLEKFMVDLVSGEEYVEVLFDRIKKWTISVGKKLVELGVDGIWTGDDVGAQNGMLISPRLWRQLFKPRLAEIFQELRGVNPDVLIMYHSDGAVAPILDDLIEIGMDVFNPVQPNVPGHDPQNLKDQFGGRLAFWGAIDQQNLLPNASLDEIRQDVAEKVRILGAGGGYMIAPAHIIQADVKPERVLAFIQAARGLV
jgi:uroporphyrinogen decarboxylase